MPNATVRANAQAMPDASLPSRRTALGSLFAAGAARVAPVEVEAAYLSDDPDAELFALQPLIEAADRQLDVVLAALNFAEEKASARYPEKPSRSTGTWQAYDAAIREWEQDRARISAECGLDVAKAAQDEAWVAIRSAANSLMEIPATTLAGLIFKAKYAAVHYPDDTDVDVALAILDDLLELAGEA